MDENAFQQAVELHRAGRLAEAEAIYRRILADDPNDADVCHLLGVLAKQMGRDDEAIDLIGRAIELDPDYAEAHFNFGNALADRNRLDEAITSYERAVQLLPDYAEAHFNLANVFLKTGRLDEAMASLERIGKSKPDYASAYNNLGKALAEKGRCDDAITAYRRAIHLKADFVEAYSNLAAALADIGDLEGAIASCRRAIEIKPDYPQGHFNLGNSLLEKGLVEEAIASYQRATQVKPDFAEAHDNLGNALTISGQPDAAIVALERAIQLRPDMAAAHSSLGNALKDKGEIEQALASYRRAVVICPDDPKFHSNLIYALHYDPSCTVAQLRAELRQWAKQHADPLKPLWPVHQNDRNPDRRLRVGYVSPDFRAHAVGRFMLPLLASHDRTRVEIFCYASVRSPDSFTSRMKGHADVWRDIAGLSNEQTAKLVGEDRIDILVDLTMHTAKNRLPLFARKPAPIQVSYLAYPGTTGLDAIDYRITDPYLDPPDTSQENYTEQSVRLPKNYWCYEPPISGLEPCSLPADRAGFITFGCLNNFCKMTPVVLETWRNLLAAVAGSRLILHAAAGSHRDRVRQIFTDSGIDPGRVVFVAKLSLPDYMNQYREIDIALDPFPYVGGTTTCDALWMGVPVVTLFGQTALARGGVSILSNIGLPELIARNPEEYVQIAAGLAGDIARLRRLRSTLQQQMLRSPLMDEKSFASDMENAFRLMWRNWCVRSS